jgi:hypothetical protein
MKTKFLEEAPGVQSYQRLQSLILLITFVVVTLYQIYNELINFDVLVLLAVASTAPKLIQKFTEVKQAKSLTNGNN